MLPVFFEEFFLETFPPILFFFQSSICLRFFLGRVFGNELREFPSPFSGFGVFFAVSLSLPLRLLLLLFWGPARAPLLFLRLVGLQDTGHPVPAQAGAHGSTCLSFSLSPLSARVGRLPLFLRPCPFAPSLFFFSCFFCFFLSFFFLSLSLLHASTSPYIASTRNS